VSNGAGTEADIEAYYRRYAPMVLRRCRRLLRDEEAAVDAMQDVFVRLLQREEVLQDSAPSSLLLKVATNVCLNRIRTRRRRPEDGDPDLFETIAFAGPGAGEDTSLARSILNRLFGEEPESTRLIAVMHHLDGMTHEEVAAEVGLSVSGVRKRLRKLRHRLQGVSPAGTSEVRDA
jgi:RNA polymerase sigma-70 factor (ECF subfamily)